MDFDMVVTPYKKLALAERRKRVAEMYVESMTQVAIAQELGVGQSTVSDDLRAIRREWRESRIRDFDELVDVELQRIDRLEREAWDAWRRSKEPLEHTRMVQTEKGTKQMQKTIQQRVGDPRYLEQIAKCIASRRALLGLDAPTRIAPTSPDGTESYHVHVMAELMRLAEHTKDGPIVIDQDYIAGRLTDHSQLPASTATAATPGEAENVITAAHVGTAERC